MRIGEIEEEGERAIPGYTPPKPGAVPPAPVRRETPAPAPVKAPEKEKEHAAADKRFYDWLCKEILGV